MNYQRVLLLIIFLEGFFTLSLELIAIRKLTPYIGNNSEIVAIIISAVLLPLSFGYYFGGKKYKNKLSKNIKTKIKTILFDNITVILYFTCIGFSNYFLDFYFDITKDVNILIKTFIFTLIFLSIPAFLLGQTVPLITNYFSKKYISDITGKILFISTIGSFSGSILTTIILMNIIGVDNSLLLSFYILFFIAFLLKTNVKTFYKYNFFLLIPLMILTTYFSYLYKYDNNIIYDNQYSTTKITTIKDNKLLNVNNSYSSLFNKNKKTFFRYVMFINNLIKEEKNKKILVLGAGGFTIGKYDNDNNYTFIDIDKDLLPTSEKYFLENKLEKNKRFIAEDRNYFLLKEINNNKKYDIVIVDLYTNLDSIPSNMITINFFQNIKKILKIDGFFIMNRIMNKYLKDDFDIKLNNTINKIFPFGYKQNVERIYNLNDKKTNFIYVKKNINKEFSNKIYTNDLNDYMFDK